MRDRPDWFLGQNHLDRWLYDPSTGGCRDGLHAERANETRAPSRRWPSCWPVDVRASIGRSGGHVDRGRLPLFYRDPRTRS
jgi:hypothetical protein